MVSFQIADYLLGLFNQIIAVDGIFTPYKACLLYLLQSLESLWEN
jgi:hypothetical protein